jgi:beta-carotene hydroxylase
MADDACNTSALGAGVSGDAGGFWFLATVALMLSPLPLHRALNAVRGPLDFSKFRPLDKSLAAPPRLELTLEELAVPSLAWPTVLLCVASLALWASAGAAYAQGALALWQSFPMSAAGIYGAFTPMHDAVHNAVSRNRALNDAVGHLAAIPFVMGLPLFRFVHINHHRYNNDDDNDPDIWAGEGPTLLLPLRWATVIQYYVHWIISRYAYEKAHGGLSAALGKATSLAQPASFVLAALLAAAWLDARLLWAVWLGPVLAASTWLMYLFDYVPHRPHGVSDRENPYLATNFTRGLFAVWELSFLMLYQNMHLIHHLYPSVPFYRYRVVYYRHQAELERKGALTLPLLNWFAAAAPSADDAKKDS